MAHDYCSWFENTYAAHDRLFNENNNDRNILLRDVRKFVPFFCSLFFYIYPKNFGRFLEKNKN